MIAPFQHIDHLNLDSYDVNFENPHHSAMHHMKELLDAAPLISKDTLILVDDSPSCAHFFFEEGFIKIASNQKIGGKGKYVASFMENIGNKASIQAYQAAWISM